MFDVPIDGWYAWLGVAAVSVLALGTVASLPTAPPPDATAVADAIDRTAASQHEATAEVPIEAGYVRLGPQQIGLRNDAGTAHASFAYGPVIPAVGTARLDAILRGAPPDREFDSPAQLRAAGPDRSAGNATWHPADGALIVRKITWNGVDVTLVGWR